MPRQSSCTCGACRKCKHREYMRQWYQRKTPEERREWVSKRDPERIRENERNRYQRDREKRDALNRAIAHTPEGKESRRKTQKKWRAAHPERVRAHKLVRRAIDRGDLVREPCENCANPKSEAHHEDYAKPLDVRWLCRRCHHEEHRRPF